MCGIIYSDMLRTHKPSVTERWLLTARLLKEVRAYATAEEGDRIGHVLKAVSFLAYMCGYRLVSLTIVKLEEEISVFQQPPAPVNTILTPTALKEVQRSVH